MSDTVSVSREIAAPAEDVWRLVADVTRMGQWSPESTGASWLNGATEPALGATFKGTNLLGKAKWSTKGTITDCRPGEMFAFEVTSGPFKVSRWEYHFAPTEHGCTVTESWTDRRGWLVKTVGKRMTGVDDRASHNRTSMEATLEALDRAATS